ncbi:MAG TPA: hypothetical protein VFS76_18365 [Pyrinomonadaceae bacterium]|nr:hypothetical protein [Pyrinomonadaceae bacterium]
MSFKSVTTTIDLILAALTLAAGRRQLNAVLDRTYVHKVLSRNPKHYKVNGLSFYHDGELIMTSPEGQILANNGLLVAGSNPLSSMSDVELDKVGRSNNKKSTYKIHQDELSDLYGSRADSLIIYPLLLINNCERNENQGKLRLVPAADKWNLAGEDQLIIGANEVSLENYKRGWGVAFVMVLLHNLRGLYCLAKYFHHSGMRRCGDRFAEFAKFLTAFLSPSTARIAEFLTTVFQPFRYVLVQAYGRLVHCLCREDRTAVNTQKQQPLFEMTNGLSRLWNCGSFRMIPSRHLAATWEDTHVAAQTA